MITDRQLAMFNLDCTTFIKMCYLWSNYFKQQLEKDETKYYRILNVASFAGLIAIPFMAVYSGVKHFIHTFSLALREELSNYKRITVTSLNPSYTETPSIIKGHIHETVAWTIRAYHRADIVAKVGYYHMMNGSDYVLVGWMPNLLYWLSKTILPLSLSLKFVKLMNADVESLKGDHLIKEGLTAHKGNEGEEIGMQ